MVPKRRRPPRLSGGGLIGPKAKEAPSPQRRGPRWSQSQRGPLASAAGASMVRKPSMGEGKIPDEPTGRPYPPAAQAGPEGLGCNRRCVGEGRIPNEPTGRPYPSAAQAGPEGLGCNRRCVGEGKTLHEPTGRPYPSAAQAGPEGLGCNRRCVGEGRLPNEPTGRPYPSAAQAGPEGLGCNRRCVGSQTSRLQAGAITPVQAARRVLQGAWL